MSNNIVVSSNSNNSNMLSRPLNDHRVTCPRCRRKLDFPIEAPERALEFIDLHGTHNFTGLVVELIDFPSPRPSDHYEEVW